MYTLTMSSDDDSLELPLLMLTARVIAQSLKKSQEDGRERKY
ncbi:hypothetical protein [Lysinibacillus sp. NPDC047702]